MLLCDHVQVADGKLFINGGGWSVTGPSPVPHGVAVLLGVPWDRTNARISFRLALADADGRAVGDPPIEVAGEFEVGRPPGMPPGTPLDVPLAFNFPPLPLSPGRRYVWTLVVDGETQEDWQVGFLTRTAGTALPASPPGPTDIGLPPGLG